MRGVSCQLESRRAALRLAQARQRLSEFEAVQEQSEFALSVVLGFGPDDRVRTTTDEPASPELPADEAASIESALANSKEVQRIESAMQARGLEARGARASWLPQFDLVAQYGLFAKFNNYEDYFQKFSRNNAQLGVAIAFPVFAGRGAKARATQADLEVTRLRTQANALRDRIALDARKAWSDVRRAESARELARLDLEFTREQLSVTLAQSEEGRASFRQVEEVRAAETEKWLAYYDAVHALERARIDLVRVTGTILAALRYSSDTMERVPEETSEIVHADTALMVAACRAMETEREGGLVHDPFAARLAGERGMAFARSLPMLPMMCFGIGVRSKFMDEFVMYAVGAGRVETVLSLGAGLDSRAWRLDIPHHVRWIEVDLPPMLEYKSRMMAGISRDAEWSRSART